MRAATVIALTLVLAGGCGSGVSADPGLAATMRVTSSRAQFFPGEPPATTSGPAVLNLQTPFLQIYPGQRSRGLSGEAAPSAVAFAVGLEGDAGYWVIPGGSPDAFSGNATFSTSLAFSNDLPPGTASVFARAVGGDGTLGPASTLQYTVTTGDPTGALVVSLSWDTEADLDLHVVQPDGIEIWSKNINAYVPPPLGETPPPANVILGYGILDIDSNADCVIDGRRRENAVWRDPPPSGRYLVRVDAYSLCAQTAARWTVRAILAGVEVARASGTSTDSDTRFPHQAGAGVLALQLDVP
jgi:hypothetical protein